MLRYEMGTGIVEIIGMETQDGHRYCGPSWDGDKRQFLHLLRVEFEG
jgi:hypothetical protein